MIDWARNDSGGKKNQDDGIINPQIIFIPAPKTKNKTFLHIEINQSDDTVCLFVLPAGRLSKAHKDKERQQEKAKQKEKEKEREKEKQRQEEKERRSDGAKHRSSDKDDRKRKHRESSQDRCVYNQKIKKCNVVFPLCAGLSFCFVFSCREKPPIKEARKTPAPPCWLQRDLKVRFIDRTFKGGRYYNSKVLTCTSYVRGFFFLF